MRKSCGWPLLVLSSLVFFGCDPEKEPIVRLSVEPQELSLSYPHHQEVEVHLTPLAYPLRGGCPMMFIHLLDGDGGIVRTFDQPVPGWTPGKELRFSVTLFQSALAEPLPTGNYQLVGGLYGPRFGKRFGATFEGEAVGTFSYSWAQVDVLSSEKEGPELLFLEGWEGVETGQDRQILGRRWLHRQGVFSLHGPSSSLDLWMLVKVPGDIPGFELEIEEGTQPELSLRIVCREETVFLTPGFHELRFNLPALGPSESCEIEMWANFNLPAKGEFPAGRSISLEAISWRPKLSGNVKP